MSKEQVEKALGREVAVVYDADSLDESKESPELLAREAARGILAEYGEEPEEVMEAADGFLVSGGGHAIFMGHDGSFDLADLPGGSDDDDDTTEEDDETPAKFVLVQKETGVAVGPAQELTKSEAEARTAGFEEAGTPLYYVPESEVENGRLKPAMTLDELQAQVEALLADADPTDEKVLEALRAFDNAKARGNYDEAVGAAKMVVGSVGKEFIPRPPVPPEPGKPLDTGPGPGKNTGTGGGGQPRIGVPAPSAPAPKKPVDTGPGPGKSTGSGKNEGEDEEKAVQFTFPAERIQEFLEIAQKAGVGNDAKVVAEDNRYTVRVSESVAPAIAVFFTGDDVVQETVQVGR